MEVAILIFDRLTALDAIGPYEVLRSMPGATVKFVAKEAGPKRTDAGSLALVADYALEEVNSPDIIVVPGGPGQMVPLKSRGLPRNHRKIDGLSRNEPR